MSFASDYGLRPTDCRELERLVRRRLWGRWLLIFERTEAQEVYARIVAPWNTPDHSAFLIERQGSMLLLTDRVANPVGDSVSRHHLIPQVFDGILDVVTGREDDSEGQAEKDHYMRRATDMQPRVI